MVLVVATVGGIGASDDDKAVLDVTPEMVDVREAVSDGFSTNCCVEEEGGFRFEFILVVADGIEGASTNFSKFDFFNATSVVSLV